MQLFEDWILELTDIIMSDIDYDYIRMTEEEYWLSYYADGMTPIEAWDEEKKYMTNSTGIE